MAWGLKCLKTRMCFKVWGERPQRGAACNKCGAELPPSAFWPMDINNRGQNGGLSCKGCQSTPPSERAQARVSSALTCRTCEIEKPRAEFWPTDISNRRQNGGLSCTTCEPTAPSDRRKRKQSAASGRP